jgi:hypothetical protein
MAQSVKGRGLRTDGTVCVGARVFFVFILVWNKILAVVFCLFLCQRILNFSFSPGNFPYDLLMYDIPVALSIISICFDYAGRSSKSFNTRFVGN